MEGSFMAPSAVTTSRSGREFLDGGLVVRFFVALLDPLAELLGGRSERPCQFRKFAGTEEQDEYHEDDDEFLASGHGGLLRRSSYRRALPYWATPVGRELWSVGSGWSMGDPRADLSLVTLADYAERSAHPAPADATR
jgi:hypothetical protein